jgi:hypothetical protein
VALSERLQFLLTVDAKGAVKGFEQVSKAADKELSKAEQRLDKLGDSMVKGGAAAMAFAGVSALALGKTVQAFQKQERAELLLQNTMANMPKLAGESADQFLELAAAIQRKTVVGDEDVVSSMAMLGTFNLTADEIKRVTPLVVDYAQKFGVDLVSAATQVGKALDGNVGALKRNGVSIDEAMFKTDRFGAVVDALGNQVAGFAEAEAQTFNGQIQQMKNNLGDLAEGVGAGVVDVVGGAARSLNGLSQSLNSVNPGITRTAGQFAALGTAAIGAIGALSFVGGQAIKMRDRFTVLGDDGTRSLNNLGKAAKGVGVAMGVAAAALAVYAIHQSQAARAAAEMAEIQQKVTSGSVQQVEQYAKELAAVIQLRGGYDKFIDGNLEAAVRMLQVAEASESTRAEFERQGITLDDMRAAVDEAAESQARANRVSQDAQSIVNELTGELDELADGSEDAADAAAELARKSEAVKKAMDAERKAVEDAVRAINDKRDASRRAADASFNLRRAEDGLRDAVRAANDVVKSGTTDLREIERAMDDATQAAAAQADAVVELKDQQAVANGQTLTGQQRQAEWNRAMLASAATLDGPLQQAVVDYIADVNRIPRGTLTDVKVRIDEAAFNLAEARLNALAANREANVTVRTFQQAGGSIGTGGVRTRHTGGRVAAGQIIQPLSGEAFVSDTPGKVMSRQDLARVGGGESGPVVNISMTVDGNVYGDTAFRRMVEDQIRQSSDAVRDALARHARFNGPGS